MNRQVSQRDSRIDALRGLFLMIMAAVHVPTPLSHWLQEPFGYISSAEGFIFMSAGLAGLVYGKVYAKHGWDRMAGKVWQRAGKVYAAQLGVLIPIALLAWMAAGSLPPLASHFHDFLQQPVRNLGLMALLAQQPPLFDILPIYVGFLGMTPLVLAAARRYGWRIVLLASVAVWLVAQFGPGLQVSGPPYRHMPLHSGPFDLRAWQLLWVAGLALGQTWSGGARFDGARRHWGGWLAGAVVAIGLLSRHGALATPPDLYLLMDKWSLGPLRMLDFAAWVVVLLAWNPRLPAGLLAGPALLGRQSLAVFSVHLPLVIAASCLIQMGAFRAGSQVAIGLMVIAMLFPVALWEERRAKRWVEAATGAAPKPSNGVVEGARLRAAVC